MKSAFLGHPGGIYEPLRHSMKWCRQHLQPAFETSPTCKGALMVAISHDFCILPLTDMVRPRDVIECASMLPISGLCRLPFFVKASDFDGRFGLTAHFWSSADMPLRCFFWFFLRIASMGIFCCLCTGRWMKGEKGPTRGRVLIAAGDGRRILQEEA